MTLFVCPVALYVDTSVIKGVFKWYLYKIEVSKWKK